MNAHIKTCQLLLAFLLGMVAGQTAQANCSVNDSLGVTPTTRIDATAAVGAIMYNETWTLGIRVSCFSGTRNVLRSTAFNSQVPHRLQGEGGPSNHNYESSVDIADTEKTVSGSTVTYVLPSGTFSSRIFTVTVNLRYRRGSDGVSGRLEPRESGSFRAFNTLEGDIPVSNNPTFFLAGEPISISYATCAIGSQTVQMSSASLASFVGVGTVPTAGKTDFNVSFECSNVNAGMRVGLSFATSDQHASRTAGVIRTSQDANNAADIALQIVNLTTGLPIRFGQFEPGVAKTGNGIYQNLYRVQYFQTGANPTAGSVRGTTIATVVYQ